MCLKFEGFWLIYRLTKAVLLLPHQILRTIVNLTLCPSLLKDLSFIGSGKKCFYQLLLSHFWHFKIGNLPWIFPFLTRELICIQKRFGARSRKNWPKKGFFGMSLWRSPGGLTSFSEKDFFFSGYLHFRSVKISLAVKISYEKEILIKMWGYFLHSIFHFCMDTRPITCFGMMNF